ncbi:PKD domain-containing protein [Actinokineospora globicatena]|uniref:PKD domain-containing protein n=1 Tax=Actinokineospora globicatena TaxID=103729 RepID=UPI0020A250FD|nr:PKD domain-containing protein [Actinokineospora globicatena]MCP2303485.1 PKD repeat-containing protein [Actinokineospora globicatena]GLW79381.1 hypothetical protein Aglo01_38630 [Actinokineospora globicatena]GLW86209.1 hypothetical protein Aglo02_38480 [Actinokineospora globicatena]
MDLSDRRLLTRGLLLALLWLGVAVWAAAAASSFTLTVHPVLGSQYFTPNGDGHDDAVTIPYCLSGSAHVDITVVDAAGSPVRMLETAASRPADPGCGYATTLTWDGKSDAGTVVPDGIYTVRIHAVSASGETADAAAQVGVESRTPGAITAPAPGDSVSGVLEWRFTPTPGINSTYVSLACGTVQLGGAGPQGGVFRGSADTTRCAPGANSVTATAFWTDPLGATHTWVSPPTPISVDNPPQVTVWSESRRYFSPNGDGQADTVEVYYCLTKDAQVAATVTDSTGAVVRAIAPAAAIGGTCFSFNNSLTWDGHTDLGQQAPNGVYRVTVTATDTLGQSSTDAVDVGVDSRVPGVLTSPAAGAEVPADLEWSFAPTPLFALGRVNLVCGDSQMGTLDLVTFTGTASSRECDPASGEVNAEVFWTDPFGASQWWVSPAVPVTFTAPPSVRIEESAHRYFSPNGDGQDDTAEISYCLGRSAAVGLVVTDESASVVRTIAPTQVDNQRCGDGGPSVTWDGKNDAGAVVADGVYTVRVQATDAAGRTGFDTVQVGVDTRNPGTLTEPAAGSTVAGEVAWRFVPTPGFTADVVSLQCGDINLVRVEAPAAFAGTVDTAPCASGANTFVAHVEWTDPFGTWRYWETPPTPVTVDNTPVVELRSAPVYFSPNGDGQEDTVVVRHCLSLPAAVSATVTNQAGVVVRSLPAVDTVPAPRCRTLDSVSWDGKNDTGQVVPDGEYTVRVRATGGTGRYTEGDVRVGVDSRIPGRVISPQAGDTLTGAASAVFAPTSGFPVGVVDITFDTGGATAIHGPSEDGLWRTTFHTGTLTPGPATMHTTVSWTDAFGMYHAWFAPQIAVAIDSVALPLSVSANPASGPAPLATTLRIDTSEPRAGTVHYTVSFGDGTPDAHGDISSPYATTQVPHTYATPGVRRAVVTVTNDAGASTSKTVDITATGAANTAPTASLTLDTTRGVAPLLVTATPTGEDPQGDPLTYTLDFGDGTAPASGALPRGALGHTYSTAGTYLVRLTVSDGRLSATRTATVTVGLAEPLVANAGDDVVANEGTAVRFNGSAARPTTGIESYRWDFGDGATGTGVTTTHVYPTAGTYTAALTVTAAGETRQDTVFVKVIPRPPSSGLAITVTDNQDHLLGSADVLVERDGVTYPAVTDPAGMAFLHGLPDGTYTVYAGRTGYLPNKTTATITDNAGSARVALSPGEVAATNLTSEPMTREEVVAAGIDPDDPANANTYSFSVNVALDPGPEVTVTGYGGDGGFSQCPKVAGTQVTCDRRGATWRDGDNEVSLSTSTVEEKPQLTWLVMPARASWLKEFFSVRMTVMNLADEPFTLADGVATLPLPAGLSLAPMAISQTESVPMGTISAHGSATAVWVLRGDAEGNYPLTASYTGSLEPLGKTVKVTAATARPLHVWGSSALTMTVDVDAKSDKTIPFEVRVSLNNVADVPVYNPAVEALPERAEGFIYQPRERLKQGTDVINPGQSLTATYFVIPNREGEHDFTRSFVGSTAAGRSIPTKLVQHARGDRGDLAVDTKGRFLAKLRWSPIPGATEYQIFATRSDQTPFPDEPELVTTGTSAALVLPAGNQVFYAVSATVNGIPVMRHNLVGAEGTYGQPPKLKVTYDDDQAVDSVVDVSRAARKLKVRATDSDGQIPVLTWAPAAGATADHVHCAPVAGTAGLDCVLDQGGYRTEIVFSATDGEHDPTARSVLIGGQYVALGDSYSSGEGAVPTPSDLYDPRGGRPWFIDRDGTNTDTDLNSCHRSHHAYPYLLAGDSPTLSFHACSGAVIENMTVAKPGTRGGEARPQIDHLDKHTSLVTMSIGGNDVGFSDIVSYCVKHGVLTKVPNPCERENGSKLLNEVSNLRATLVKVYDKVLEAAPNAQVYVMGYPRFFARPKPGETADHCPNWPAIGVSPADQLWINSEITHLNATIEQAISEVRGDLRARVRYVPVYDAFTGHEACRPGPMLNDVVPWPFKVPYSFHPSRAGHEALAAAMRETISGATPRAIQFGETQTRTAAVTAPGTTLTVSTAWPGSDVETSLVSPSGRVIDRSTVAADVTHDLSPTGERYVVTNAEPGQWTIRSYGADIADGGEPLTVLAEARAPVPPAPTVSAISSTTSTVAGATVAFTANATADVVWDFGDGTTSTAVNPTHVYTSTGVFTPTAIAVASSGARTVAALPPITVAAPPTPVASDQVVVTTTGIPVSVSLSGTVATGALEFRVATQPSNGTLTGTGADLRYRPAPGYTGVDRFTFTASSGGHTSAPATVTILVQPGTGASTTTTVSATPARYGDAVTLSAAVSGGVGGTLTFTVDGTVVCSEVPLAGATCRVPGLGAGSHTVTAVYSGAPGYAASEGSGTAVVERAPLVVTANGKAIVAGDPIPALDATITGFVGGPGGITGAAACTSTAAPKPPAGAYAITCTVGSLAAANYTFAEFRPATLTVTKRAATVAYSGPLSAPAGQVTLRGTVTAPAGTDRATVEFLLYSSTNTAMTTPDLRCTTPVGTPTCALNLPADNWTVVTTIPATNGYLTAPPADPVVLSIYPPSTDRAAIGAGWTDSGTFGFVVGAKNGKPAGQSVYAYRAANGNHHLVRSTGWQGGALTFGTDTVTFTTACQVTVLDPAGRPIPRLTERDLTCRIDAADKTTDTYTIIIRRPNGSTYYQAPPSPLRAGAIAITRR